MKLLKILLLAAAVAAFVSVPAWADQGVVFLAGLVIIETIFALSWNLLFGYTGLASFGHAAFFAMGAYLTGLALRTALGVPFLLLIVASGILGAVVAAIASLVLLRRTTGIHLAILTLALAEVLRIIISYSTTLGREDGLASIPRPSIDLGFVMLNLSHGTAYYLFLCAIGALLAGLLWVICSGPFGRTLVSIRQDPERAAFIGINVGRYRLLAFTLSGGAAAMSGALYAPWAQIVTPESAHWLHSTQPILASLLGGAYSFWGPLIGTVLFSIINYLTRGLVGASEIVIGTILLIIILAAPSGVAGLLKALGLRLSAGTTNEGKKQ
ncbi:branched-chain amino acid ABC transporter permease [Castellaniella sp.]|uniref:branched-chain amino acid ABC transporter permease n=1 Tax=Castellaniella sp. TaxID=1955812 RepID=UPI00355D63CD